MLMMPSDLSWGKQYFVLILVYSEPDSVFKEIKITDEQKKVLIESISKKMAPQPVKLRSDFELTCFSYEGIVAIKEALVTAK